VRQEGIEKPLQLFLAPTLYYQETCFFVPDDGGLPSEMKTKMPFSFQDYVENIYEQPILISFQETSLK
jgi:hypothetical protein